MLAVNQLAGKLVGQYSGPVLVVGGAPSVPSELTWLRQQGCDFKGWLIVSANEHAIHAGFKPDYAVVNDDVHSVLGVYQEPRMRKLMPGTKLLSRHWWADYRTPQLQACNSGLKALLYATILGANPIVVIGIQHYRNGLYFREVERSPGWKSNPNLSRELPHFTKQTDELVRKLKGVPIRTVSGPLTQIWPHFDANEVFRPRPLSQLESDAQDEAADQRYVCVKGQWFSYEGAMVPQGTIFAVTPRELEHCRFNEDVVDATKWDLSDKDQALAKHIEQTRQDLMRMREMIGKLRGSRRSISRSIYDADIMRVIKMAEAGDSPEVIGRRLSLPWQQIQFMITTMGVTVPAVAAEGLTPAPAAE